MNFTQFKFPHGRRVPENIKRSEAIEKLATELESAGWSFEVEINPDSQIVHMDCCDEDRALANRVCRNGPQVPVKVDELVTEAHQLWTAEGKPRAVGTRLDTAWRMA